MLNLSKKITSEQMLRDLGIRALKVQQCVIDSALYDHRTSIVDAAHDVLSTWFKEQPSRQEAYLNLQTGLKTADMNELAAELQYWVEGIEVDSAFESAAVSQMTDESKRF